MLAALQSHPTHEMVTDHQLLPNCHTPAFPPLYSVCKRKRGTGNASLCGAPAFDAHHAQVHDPTSKAQSSSLEMQLIPCDAAQLWKTVKPSRSDCKTSRIESAGPSLETNQSSFNASNTSSAPILTLTKSNPHATSCSHVGCFKEPVAKSTVNSHVREKNTREI